MSGMLKKIGISTLSVILSVVGTWLALVGLGYINDKRIRPAS